MPVGTSNTVVKCHSCRRPETTDRVKLVELSSHIAVLNTEENTLKSLHRQLEIRMRRFLHRTRNSILMQEKLLNLEKHTQKELLTVENLVTANIFRGLEQQQLEQLKNCSSNIDRIQQSNKHLQTDINNICEDILKLEKEFDREKFQHGGQYGNEYRMRRDHTQLTRTEDRLHRMNLELNTIRSHNSDLRSYIKRMLEKRGEMIKEYDRLTAIMENATDELRKLTTECSESFENRRNLVARMHAMKDQHEKEEKKLLEDIRELDRLLETNYASKNFILQKSNVRKQQISLNDAFAGKRSSGVKNAYTADEFRRLFHNVFGQTFIKDKDLKRAVETFLAEQDKTFSLFEYAVELINELNRLRETLDIKRKRIVSAFSKDNVDSLVVKDVFAMLEHSVSDASKNVQSLQSAKENGRQLLDFAYQLLKQLFRDIGCDQRIISTFSNQSESVNDQNILLYLALIESRVQQVLAVNKRGASDDSTTISWRTNQHTQLFSNMSTKQTTDIHELDLVTPKISTDVKKLEELLDDLPISNDDRTKMNSADEKKFRGEVIDTVLQAYRERNFVSEKTDLIKFEEVKE
ncbi:unnamed protein product [Didymodactylos carnosus]|uniref:ODAD1 central coiled coil region domain-containing protein n=1 Tax=Didymodactylos carnosus TaxID=1234261 RepID=A0A813NKQ8_9BILA|nr:unnamed protein product [Didymodactylos carnosus]CAF1066775.1 unnamed protein product [Didymodactylos carnosus]CAF3518414.1 unnamed protein product [Didymodactylos carnosus]CAF3831706.1 unnamed protein product [Didymodactylos carnosus]